MHVIEWVSGLMSSSTLSGSHIGVSGDGVEKTMVQDLGQNWHNCDKIQINGIMRNKENDAVSGDNITIRLETSIFIYSTISAHTCGLLRDESQLVSWEANSKGLMIESMGCIWRSMQEGASLSTWWLWL